MKKQFKKPNASLFFVYFGFSILRITIKTIYKLVTNQKKKKPANATFIQVKKIEIKNMTKNLL